MRLSTVALLAAASLLVSCNRPGPASPDYAEAREKWSGLLREKLDGAAADPRAEEVLALLARVDPKSIDAPFAAELKRDIEASRAEAEARADAQAKLLAQAQAGLKAAPVFESDRVKPEQAAPAPTEPAVAEPAPDAGAGPTEPQEGMDAAEFRATFARCFEYKSDSLVGGVNGGQVWGLKDLSICRDLYPRFVSNSVLLFEGKVTAIRSKEEFVPKKYLVIDGKLVPADEAAKLQQNKPAETSAAPAPAP